MPLQATCHQSSVPGAHPLPGLLLLPLPGLLLPLPLPLLLLLLLPLPLMLPLLSSPL